MFCPGCGFENNITSSECSNCSMKNSSTCNTCGCIIMVTKGAKFCYECGSSLKLSKVKHTRQQLVNIRYPNELFSIRAYLSSNAGVRWVSYQEIAKHIELTSCYDKLSNSDDKSTVGYLIYLDNIRAAGYEVKVFNARYDDISAVGTRKSFVMRYIRKSDSDMCIISNDQITADIIDAYHNLNLDKLYPLLITEKI